MNNSKRTLLIEAFLDGKMSDAEKHDFEIAATTDSSIKEDLYLQNEIRNTFEEIEIFNLREKLYEIKNENAVYTKRRKLTVFLTSAAAIFIVLIVSYYFLFYSHYSNKELYNKYYTAAETGNISRGSDSTGLSVFNTAMLNYQNKKFNEAISGFRMIPAGSGQHHAAVFYTAISYMEKGEYDKAISGFSELENNKTSLFYYDALWYSGLCHIILNNNNKAAEIFSSLAGSDSAYRGRASEIVKEID